MFQHLMDVWVQGLRSEADCGHELAWQEVLHRRLCGSYAVPGPTETTREAEGLLGWDHQAYWYVGRSEPSYGRITVVHSLGATPSEVRVLPFDSGGMVLGRMATSAPLDGRLRCVVVAQADRPAARPDIVMRNWLAEAYSLAGSYVLGQPPALPAPGAEMVVLGAPNTARAWTWEGRLEARDYGETPLPPERVYIRPGDVDSYYEWLSDTTDDVEYDADSALFESLVTVTPAPFESFVAQMENLAR